MSPTSYRTAPPRDEMRSDYACRSEMTTGSAAHLGTRRVLRRQVGGVATRTQALPDPRSTVAEQTADRHGRVEALHHPPTGRLELGRIRVLLDLCLPSAELLSHVLAFPAAKAVFCRGGPLEPVGISPLRRSARSPILLGLARETQRVGEIEHISGLGEKRHSGAEPADPAAAKLCLCNPAQRIGHKKLLGESEEADLATATPGLGSHIISRLLAIRRQRHRARIRGLGRQGE